MVTRLSLVVLLLASAGWGQTTHCVTRPAGDGCNTEEICDNGIVSVTLVFCGPWNSAPWIPPELPIVTRHPKLPLPEPNDWPFLGSQAELDAFQHGYLAGWESHEPIAVPAIRKDNLETQSKPDKSIH
jgi:hypothetical protein